MRLNQSGRSMMEMLGVLAIIGVLSVGGFEIFQRSQVENRNNELMSNIADLGRVIYGMRRHSMEMGDFSNNYAVFFNRIKKVPGSLTYNSTNSNFTDLSGATIDATYDNGYAIIKVSNMIRTTCIKIASNNWGSQHSNGFIGVIINSDAAKAQFKCAAAKNCTSSDNAFYSGSTDYPVPIAKATAKCNATGNYVSLGYAIDITNTAGD